MKKHSTPSIGVVALAAMFGSGYAHAQSAWLPQEKQFIATPSYVYQTFDEFWMGKGIKANPAWGEAIKQHTFSVSLEYGIAKDWAADLNFGYTRSEADFAGEKLDGMMDTTAGVRYRILDESTSSCPYAPTLTLRLGGILAGSYPTSTTLPHAPGDGASGWESSLLWGKAIGDTGFGLFGDLGYRDRAEGVPSDLFFSAGVYKTLFQHWTLSTAYRHVRGLSGININDDNFNGRFTLLKEIKETVEVGVGYTDKHDFHYQIFGAMVVDGRNTGEATILGASASFGF